LNGSPLELTCQEISQKLSQNPELVLLDCREELEHELVAIKGDLLIPMSQLVERQQELAGKENQPICVYCHHGVRSAQVVAWLREQGFSQAFSMAGGIDAWAETIEPSMKRY